MCRRFIICLWFITYTSFLNLPCYIIKLTSQNTISLTGGWFSGRREKQAYILSTQICTEIAIFFFLQIPSLKQPCIPCVLDSNIDTRIIYTTYIIYINKSSYYMIPLYMWYKWATDACIHGGNWPEIPAGGVWWIFRLVVASRSH